MKSRSSWSFLCWVSTMFGFTNKKLETGVQESVSLKPFQESVSLKPVQKPVLIVAYDEHLQSRVTSDVDGEDVLKHITAKEMVNGEVKIYGSYLAMDEEGFCNWLQTGTPSIALDRPTRGPAAQVEMNAKASDSLNSVKCGTVTWKPKPVLFLVDAKYLQKGNMEANATANSDKHLSAINIDHLMRRTQGETSTTSQDNLNRAPEAEVDEVVKASESVESVQSVPSPSKAEPVLFLVPTAGYPQSRVTREGVVEDGGVPTMAKELLSPWGTQTLINLEETVGVQHYGPYIAMDEEDYRLWLQIELSAVEVEMNARTSDFLFLESVKCGSSTVTWKPKSVLVLDPAEYLQKEDMEANATANSDKHHIAINMDHLMRRTQGETTITSQNNLNRAPEAGNTNRAADQQEDSWQSENDKQVADSGWKVLTTFYAITIGTSTTIILNQDQTDKACLFLLILAFTACTTLLALLISKRPTSLIKISKWVSIVLVVIVIGLLAYALLLELIYMVMVIIVAVITVILGPVVLICIGRWKGGSQQSATDKEAIECGWKSCLMNFVASTTLIVGVFHVQERPTQECIASFVLPFILNVGELVLLNISEIDTTIHVWFFVHLIDIYTFTSNFFLIVAVDFLLYPLFPGYMVALLVVLTAVTIFFLVGVTCIWRKKGGSRQSKTGKHAEECGWKISLMIPIMSLGSIIGMYIMPNHPPAECFLSLVTAIFSSICLSSFLRNGGHATHLRGFVLVVYCGMFITIMSMLVPFVYLVIHALVK